MPKVPTGEVRWTDEGPVARVTMQGRERESFLMPACKTVDEATTRSKLLASSRPGMPIPVRVRGNFRGTR